MTRGEGFLSAMASASAVRARAAIQAESLGALRGRAANLAPAPALRLDDSGFDVIAEVKLRSPSAGTLANEGGPAEVAQRAHRYAACGACAVSVLTEPERFDGALNHMSAASAATEALGVPVMRKDFLVDPYQVFEARVAGAGGVLLILRMLSDGQLVEMMDAAREAGVFVLLESFDGDDLARAFMLAGSIDCAVLFGVNSRDLATLKVDPLRLAALALSFPDDAIKVAESGIVNAQDAANAARLGYRIGLIGTALMQAADPGALLHALLAAARGALLARGDEQ